MRCVDNGRLEKNLVSTRQLADNLLVKYLQQYERKRILSSWCEYERQRVFFEGC